MKSIDHKQLRADLKIDEYNLQNEWLNQSNLFMSYASKAAKSRQIRDILKKELAKKFLKKKGKLSEAALTRMIEAHPDVIDAQYQRDMYKYAVQAFEMRKKALEHLQELFLGGFFSDPTDKPIKKPKKKK